MNRIMKVAVIAVASLVSFSSFAGDSSSGEWVKVANAKLKSGLNSIEIDDQFKGQHFDKVRLKPTKENMRIRDLYVFMKGDDGATTHQMYGLLRKASFSPSAVVKESDKSIARFSVNFEKSISNSINLKKSSIEIWAHKASI